MRYQALLPILALVLGLACHSTRAGGPVPELTYVGSSTVGAFIKDARSSYIDARFILDTAPESAGGEAAMLESATDLAGVAREPQAATLSSGVEATLIGRDAIAVIVPKGLGVRELSSTQLRGIFQGDIRNWSDVGGPALAIHPMVVAPESATRRVLREKLLGGAEVVGAEVVKPDRALVARVAGTPGAIGAISFAFASDEPLVLPLVIDGQAPSVVNFEYPIARPLYLLWRRGDPAVAAFVQWSLSPAGQRVVMGRFVGVDVRGSVGAVEPTERKPLGALVVETETFEVQDGGLLYYPHSPYEICTRHGDFVRRVRNHRGLNDEQPTRIELEPGIYLIRTETRGDQAIEFFVTIRQGATTELNVPEQIDGGGER